MLMEVVEAVKVVEEALTNFVGVPDTGKIEYECMKYVRFQNFLHSPTHTNVYLWLGL